MMRAPSKTCHPLWTNVQHFSTELWCIISPLYYNVITAPCPRANGRGAVISHSAPFESVPYFIPLLWAGAGGCRDSGLRRRQLNLARKSFSCLLPPAIPLSLPHSVSDAGVRVRAYTWYNVYATHHTRIIYPAWLHRRNVNLRRLVLFTPRSCYGRDGRDRTGYVPN